MPGPAEFIHGDMLIGTVINILLYGIMITQVYIYFTTYRRDSIFVKIFVWALFLVDGVNTVFEIIYMYECLIIHYGQPLYLIRTNYKAEIAIASTVLITLMVQLFYAWRILVLTRNWLLVTVVVSVSLTAAAFGGVVTWETIVKVPQYIRILEIKGLIVVCLTCAAAADIMITAILVWHLLKHRSGFRQTDMAINRIIRITMQTCLVNTVVAVINLALFVSIPSGTYMALTLVLCKLYSNSLLSSLNSRGGWNFATAATPEHDLTDFVCETHPISSEQIDEITPQPPMVKSQSSFGSATVGQKPGAGVFIHV